MGQEAPAARMRDRIVLRLYVISVVTQVFHPHLCLAPAPILGTKKVIEYNVVRSDVDSLHGFNLAYNHLHRRRRPQRLTQPGDTVDELLRCGRPPPPRDPHVVRQIVHYHNGSLDGDISPFDPVEGLFRRICDHHLYIV